MKRLSKEIVETMSMEVLIGLSKAENMSNEFTKNSLDIINNPIDNSVFTDVLITKAKPSLLNKDEFDLKATIISSIMTVYKARRNNENNFNKDLSTELNLIGADCIVSTKLDFALNQFVDAFYEYQRLQNTYPDLMKIM